MHSHGDHGNEGNDKNGLDSMSVNHSVSVEQDISCLITATYGRTA